MVIKPLNAQAVDHNQAIDYPEWVSTWSYVLPDLVQIFIHKMFEPRTGLNNCSRYARDRTRTCTFMPSSFPVLTGHRLFSTLILLPTSVLHSIAVDGKNT